ncbi:MAG: ion channel [Thermodesulfobacteriota bacterium]|nr:ion channel [Thermodesulfobacteriota bacterium]
MKIFLSKDAAHIRQKPGLLDKFRAYRYTYLFIAILAQLTLLPLLEKQGRALVPLLFLLIVFTVLWTLDIRRIFFWLCLGLGFVGSVVKLLALMLNIPVKEAFYLTLIGLSVNVLFLMIVIVIFLAKIFSEDKVTGESIKGGISIYFLLGYLWANLYSLVLLVNPEAISFPAHASELSYILYFSFTTLTTLGYGDITPVSLLARNLTILESTIGQIYLTVLIARLVGLQLVHRSTR